MNLRRKDLRAELSIHITLTYDFPKAVTALSNAQIINNLTIDLPTIGGIYLIECLKEARTYVGESENIKHRLKPHFVELLRGVHKNPMLQIDFKKHGLKNFSVRVVKLCADLRMRKDAEAIKIAELLAIDTLLYNMTSDGKDYLRQNKDHSGSLSISDHYRRQYNMPQPIAPISTPVANAPAAEWSGIPVWVRVAGVTLLFILAIAIS